MSCLSVCFFFHFNIIFDLSKVNNFRETKIVDWHRAVTVSHVGVMFFFVYVITYIVFSFCSLSNEKSLFSNVSTASFVSFFLRLYLAICVWKKNVFIKKDLKGARSLRFYFLNRIFQHPNADACFLFLTFTKTLNEMKKISSGLRKRRNFILFKFRVSFHGKFQPN